MREECTAALRTQRMPTTRNEEYRFTDITPILQTVPRVRHYASRTHNSVTSGLCFRPAAVKHECVLIGPQTGTSFLDSCKHP